ncbi:Hypothetical protein D9617_40g013080 [Elsinoe fawcettii]|nr:Hypothetical protein D9617_40g013080 [Elsinoe fawcettii]
MARFKAVKTPTSSSRTGNTFLCPAIESLQSTSFTSSKAKTTFGLMLNFAPPSFSLDPNRFSAPSSCQKHSFPSDEASLSSSVSTSLVGSALRKKAQACIQPPSRFGVEVLRGGTRGSKSGSTLSRKKRTKLSLSLQQAPAIDSTAAKNKLSSKTAEKEDGLSLITLATSQVANPTAIRDESSDETTEKEDESAPITSVIPLVADPTAMKDEPSAETTEKEDESAAITSATHPFTANLGMSTFTQSHFSRNGGEIMTNNIWLHRATTINCE